VLDRSDGVLEADPSRRAIAIVFLPEIAAQRASGFLKQAGGRGAGTAVGLFGRSWWAAGASSDWCCSTTRCRNSARRPVNRPAKGLAG
jgi:hypothetical protein